MAMVMSYVIRYGRKPLWGRNAVGSISAVASLCAVVLGLAGCNTPAGVQPSGAPKMLTPEQALIFPPPGGPEVLTVIDRTFSNAVQQEVILRSDAATPGQNYIKVQLYGPQKAGDEDRGGLSNSSLRVSSIAREIRSAFPGVAMSTTSEYLQNSYGSFSYASGKGYGQDTCLYGWQQIRSAESMRQGFRNLGRINVTLRLCQSGATVRDLLSVMYNYTITGSYKSPNWNPYGTAQPPDAGLGRAGNPMYPHEASQLPMQPGLQTVVRPAVAARPRVVRAAVIDTAPMQEQPPVPRTPSGAPVIIPPPSSSAPTASRPASVPLPSRSAERTQISIPPPGCAAGGTANGGCD